MLNSSISNRTGTPLHHSQHPGIGLGTDLAPYAPRAVRMHKLAPCGWWWVVGAWASGCGGGCSALPCPALERGWTGFRGGTTAARRNQAQNRPCFEMVGLHGWALSSCTRVQFHHLASRIDSTEDVGKSVPSPVCLLSSSIQQFLVSIYSVFSVM
jgi:hypothetical protein